MRLTPLDIRKQEFKKAMRGLDSDEVYAFLSTIADEYEAVLNDNKALRERLLELDDKVQEYRNMERTLRDTLLTAERVTVEAKDNARRESELIIKQAEIDAEQGVRHIKANALKLRQEIQTLKRQRESYVARMKMLVESHLKFLETAEQDFVQDDQVLEEDNELSRPVESDVPEDNATLPSGEPEAEVAEEPTPYVDEVQVSKSAASVRPEEDLTGKALPKSEPTPGATPFVPPFPASSPLESAEDRPMDVLPDSNAEPAPQVVTPAEQTPAELETLLDRVVDDHPAERRPEDARSMLERLAEQDTPEKERHAMPDPGEVPESRLPYPSPADSVEPEPHRATPEPSPIEEPPRPADPTEPAPGDAHAVQPQPPVEEEALPPNRPSEWSLERLKRDILSGRSKNDETG